MEVDIAMEHPVISVWLDYNPEDHWQPYFCTGCKNMIMQYKGEVVMEMPGEHPTTTPHMVQCSNPRCKRKYNFIAFTYVLSERTKIQTNVIIRY